MADPDAELLKALEADPWGRKVLASVRLSEELYADPKVGPRFQSLIKEKFPDARIPEHDARLAGDQILSEVRKENAALRDDLKKDKDARARAEAHAWLRAQGFTDEDIPEIEKLMQDRYVGDWEVAANYYRASKQVATPRPTFSLRAEVPGRNGAGGEEFKGIIEDRRAWTLNRAAEIANDFARGQGDKWKSG